MKPNYSKIKNDITSNGLYHKNIIAVENHEKCYHLRCDTQEAISNEWLLKDNTSIDFAADNLHYCIMIAKDRNLLEHDKEIKNELLDTVELLIKNNFVKDTFDLIKEFLTLPKAFDWLVPSNFTHNISGVSMNKEPLERYYTASNENPKLLNFNFKNNELTFHDHEGNSFRVYISYTKEGVVFNTDYNGIKLKYTDFIVNKNKDIDFVYPNIIDARYDDLIINHPEKRDKTTTAYCNYFTKTRMWWWFFETAFEAYCLDKHIKIN